MISEDRICSMTRLAAFEEGEGKTPLKLANFPKTDYRALQIIKYFVLGTIAFFIVAGGYAYLGLTNGTLDMTTDGLKALGIKAAILYVVFLVIYITVCTRISMRRFHEAKLEIRDYKKQLKELSRLYEWERKLKTEGTLTHMQFWEETTEDEE